MSEDTLRNRIAARLDELGVSPITAALEVGLERTYIRDFVTGKKATLRSDKYPQVAAALKWTMADLIGQPARGILPVQPIQPVRSIDPTPQITPGDQLVGARDFPIYAAAQGGNGHLIVHSDVMEYVKRPVVLEGVPDAYGILVTGTSMIPAYRPNDMALVHPRRPPVR